MADLTIADLVNQYGADWHIWQSAHHELCNATRKEPLPARLSDIEGVHLTLIEGSANDLAAAIENQNRLIQENGS